MTESRVRGQLTAGVGVHQSLQGVLRISVGCVLSLLWRARIFPTLPVASFNLAHLVTLNLAHPARDLKLRLPLLTSNLANPASDSEFHSHLTAFGVVGLGRRREWCRRGILDMQWKSPTQARPPRLPPPAPPAPPLLPHLLCRRPWANQRGADMTRHSTHSPTRHACAGRVGEGHPLDQSPTHRQCGLAACSHAHASSRWRLVQRDGWL